MLKDLRKSSMSVGGTYFWTDTIKDWNVLLVSDNFKMIVIDSWRELIRRNKILIHGYVIMPNHLHTLDYSVKEWKRNAGSEF
jgi:putative transposase